AGGELHGHGSPVEGRCRLARALREVLDRAARFARTLPLPAGGIADMEQAKLSNKPSLNLPRRYAVSPEKVWRAWTDAETLKRWFGPEKERVSLAALDVRGG